jgi:glycerol-3-phosphate O-acyltransferase
MLPPMTLPRLLLALAVSLALLLLVWRVARAWGTRSALRAVHRFGARIDRFKLTEKRYITAALLGDERIAAAVREHAAAQREPPSHTWRRVRAYVDEIVPFFNLFAYYRFGYAASRVLLNLVYKVSVGYERPGAFASLPRESIVIYLMNHRSNADYMLAAYALAGEVSISYAVGEWARVFPLEYVFKSFGAYFVRRRYREPLYHTVLERYVQLITRNGVTQGIFPEGGLTRDGRLRSAKIGLLDYALGVAREPGFAERMYVVPVAIGYDRVLEDRSLLRELEATSGGRPPSRPRQAWEVARFAAWNTGRLFTRRLRRYGMAAVTIGEPIPLAPWLAAEGARHGPLFDRPRDERLAAVQALADDVMARIGALVPVTAVPLACAAIQSLGADFLTREKLLGRMEELRAGLLESNARVLRHDRDIAESFERAYRMLRMRRVLARQGTGYLLLPHGRELVSYYANSIAHLLGPHAESVRARDALPVESMAAV